MQDGWAYMVFIPLLLEINSHFLKDERKCEGSTSFKCQWSYWTLKVVIRPLFFFKSYYKGDIKYVA